MISIHKKFIIFLTATNASVWITLFGMIGSQFVWEIVKVMIRPLDLTKPNKLLLYVNVIVSSYGIMIHLNVLGSVMLTWIQMEIITLHILINVIVIFTTFGTVI
jgi:hypothetical protein